MDNLTKLTPKELMLLRSQVEKVRGKNPGGIIGHGWRLGFMDGWRECEKWIEEVLKIHKMSEETPVRLRRISKDDD